MKLAYEKALERHEAKPVETQEQKAAKMDAEWQAYQKGEQEAFDARMATMPLLCERCNKAPGSNVVRVYGLGIDRWESVCHGCLD